MRERFGQFQMARHYRAVEERAKAGFRTADAKAPDPAEKARIGERYFAWFERQLERLSAEPQAPRRDRGLEH